MQKTAWRAIVCLWLIGSLIGGAAGIAEAGEGLFSRLKEKAAKKIEQVKDPVWVETKLGAGAVSGIAGKITGFVGLSIGAVMGLAIGGPVGAATGGIIGSRIASAMTRAYVKPLAEGVISAKLTDRSVTVREVWQGLDKRRLAVEGSATAVGSLIGEALGVMAGAALFAGAGPLAIPIIGLVGGDIIGGKIGSWIGSKLVKKAGVMAYTALAPQPPPTPVSSASVIASATPSAMANTAADPARARYEAAYLAYVTAVQDQKTTSDQKEKALHEYNAALEAWNSARAGTEKR
ncbi:MAG TPA: hypothetical protein PKM25_13010 [Candidatus Ozemobacteraceae bacterium]|nr:hypothetical protein [Candidatus Ozemobacteraceae bacterium]